MSSPGDAAVAAAVKVINITREEKNIFMMIRVWVELKVDYALLIERRNPLDEMLMKTT